MPQTSNATGNAPSDPSPMMAVLSAESEMDGPARKRMVKISTKAPMASLMRLLNGLWMAGAVQKQASLAMGLCVRAKWSRCMSHTSVDPSMAPRNCADDVERHAAPRELAHERERNAHDRIQVRTAERASHHHADIYGQCPRGGDHDPARSVAFGAIEQHVGNNAIAQEDHEQGAQ